MPKVNPHMPLLKRLHRYSVQCLTERTDDDYANAVYEAIDLIDNLLNDLQEAQETIDALKGNDMLQSLAIASLKVELEDCRNELCYKCGDYKQRHLGSCNGCRWLPEEYKNG